MRKEFTGLVSYVGAVCLMLVGVWLSLDAMPAPNVLVSQAVAASTERQSGDAQVMRASLTADGASPVEAASRAGDSSWKPPTIRKNFSSFYSEYDLTPLPKLAKSTRKPGAVIATEQRPKKIRRRALPQEIYTQPAPQGAFAFCLFC